MAGTETDSGATTGYEAQLWAMADALRGSMDAAEYKHVVLGLIFLKYISDAFEERHAAVLDEWGEEAAEDRDEYIAENIFWVPPEARWAHLKARARQPTIGQTVDRAMAAIERDNPALKEVLPKNYARPALDKQRLGTSQVGVPSIAQPVTYLRTIGVPLPPLPEQRAIARILVTLDDKIELNRRMNETLESMARALFKSWFVDFDPVRAKMEGRDTGLPPDIADLFPDRLVDSEMGEIPEGWEVEFLGDLAKTRRRGIDPARVATDTPYIGLQHMPRRSVALTDWGEAGSVSSRKSAFEVGDILFGKLRPYFHKVGIAPVDGLCSTDIVVLNARIPKWSAFVLACVSSSAFVAHTSQTSTGTKMPRTSWQAMSTYELCRPTDAIASEFQHVVSPMLGRIVGNVHESRTLAALRDTLLPRLISGALRLEEAARIIGTTA